MMHRIIAHLAFSLKYPGWIRIHRFVQKAQWFPYEQLKREQERQLAGLVAFAYENVPYYRKTFDSLGLTPAEIRTVRDLEKLPVLNKAIIKKNWEDFVPRNLSQLHPVNRSTSGSTGTPFQYRLSRLDMRYSIALLFRSRGFGGYRLGDSLVTLSAKVQPARRSLCRILRDFIINQRAYSWFHVTRERLLQNFEELNRFKPDYIFSSPLVLSAFSKFALDNKLTLEFRPKAIFSNGEKLFDHQRSTVERVMGASVFDIYGLDDGAISANECGQHNGLHIDMERGILEVVNSEGAQVINERGRILATSLHNYALPFLRYETGDLGIISDKRCACGRQTPLLQEIAGRVEGYLVTPSGVDIHGTVLGDYISHLENVHQFQIIQNAVDEVLIRVVPEDSRRLDEINIDVLRRQISETDKNLRLTLQIISEQDLEYTKAGKHKFVINKLQAAGRS